jgi:acid phosphatase family membrane protein YuiD
MSSSPQLLSRLLTAVLRGGRAGGELPNLAAVAVVGGTGDWDAAHEHDGDDSDQGAGEPVPVGVGGKPMFVLGLVVWAVAQIAKAMLSTFVERRWDMRMLFNSDRVPSSHTTLCIALTASVALCHSVSDALFSVCIGFSLIVMYGATGVRRDTRMQTEVSLLLLLYIVVRDMTLLQKQFLVVAVNPSLVSAIEFDTICMTLKSPIFGVSYYQPTPKMLFYDVGFLSGPSPKIVFLK